MMDDLASLPANVEKKCTIVIKPPGGFERDLRALAKATRDDVCVRAVVAAVSQSLLQSRLDNRPQMLDASPFEQAAIDRMSTAVRNDGNATGGPSAERRRSCRH